MRISLIRSRARFRYIFFQEELEMNDKNTQNRQYAIGPVGAVATVPGEFISSAIFEAVQGVCRLSGKVARGLRRS
jgi:hypothetical protein